MIASAALMSTAANRRAGNRRVADRGRSGCRSALAAAADADDRMSSWTCVSSDLLTSTRAAACMHSWSTTTARSTETPRSVATITAPGCPASGTLAIELSYDRNKVEPHPAVRALSGQDHCFGRRVSTFDTWCGPNQHAATSSRHSERVSATRYHHPSGRTRRLRFTPDPAEEPCLPLMCWLEVVVDRPVANLGARADTDHVCGPEVDA
jgi:hypothetical protein